MIKDILQYRANNFPKKIFIIYKNKKITYFDFNHAVFNTMKYISTKRKSKYIGLHISNKIDFTVNWS